MRGLLVGRFQPFHLGHLAVVRQLARTHPEEELLLGVGSAQASYTWENPFTAGERLEMIERALREAKVSTAQAYPIVDVQRHAVWVAHLESLLPHFDRVYTNNPLTRVLFEQAHYTVENPPLYERDHYQGNVIRETMLTSDTWRAWVPPSIAEYLDTIRAVDRVRLLRNATSHERE